jgi:predicted alpha/beta superfamily hydrolase
LFGPGTRPDGTVAQGGGGAAFQAFLLEELRPYIETRYPIDPKAEVLFGHSLGGVFTANILARNPDAFAGYLIASPSVWADPTILARLKAVRDKAGQHRVFVGYGGELWTAQSQARPMGLGTRSRKARLWISGGFPTERQTS